MLSVSGGAGWRVEVGGCGWRPADSEGKGIPSIGVSREVGVCKVRGHSLCPRTSLQVLSARRYPSILNAHQPAQREVAD